MSAAAETAERAVVKSSTAHAGGVSALRLGWYDLDEMNEEFAFVVIGKGPMIVWRRPGAEPDEEVRLISIDAFKALSQNARHPFKDEKGKDRSISYADKWLMDSGRRDYAGLEFFPSPDGAKGRDGFLNLWRGFSLKPSAEGSWDVFRDHLLTNVCDGDPALYRWLFAWFAQMVQQPRQKPGTSIVLRGGQGYGKSIVGEMMGSLIHSHYLLVDDPRYLIGNFNIHMASLLLLQADEAVWAGDKTAEGRLKSLVTSSAQMIESKGVDPVRLANHLRIIFTSNNDWVVPAGNDERRFAVFDVAPHSAQNHGYFQELADEMNAGGRERLLHDLLAFDLSTVNLREIPKTEALAEQKIHSLDPVGLWWLDRLKAGMPTRGHHEWPDFVPTRVLVDDYVAAADRVGIHRRSSETQFAMRLKKIVPRAHSTRRSVRHDDSGPPERVYGYELPTLRDCRDDFEAYLGQPVPWDRSDE